MEGSEHLPWGDDADGHADSEAPPVLRRDVCAQVNQRASGIRCKFKGTTTVEQCSTVACPQRGHRSVDIAPWTLLRRHRSMETTCQYLSTCKRCGQRVKPRKAIVASFARSAMSHAL